MNYIISLAERCLSFKNPFCFQGRPIHTPIPQAIRLLKKRSTNM